MSDLPNKEKETFSINSDLFVGNLSLYTTKNKLYEYFIKFGSIEAAKVCFHPENGKSKRYGFVSFTSPSSLEGVLSFSTHVLDGKVLETRYATRNISLAVKHFEKGQGIKKQENRKVFIGGISQDTTLMDLKLYFQKFGSIKSTILLPDNSTGRHRGFGFMTFDDPSIAHIVISAKYHYVKDKKIECKHASPRNEQNKLSSKSLFENIPLATSWLNSFPNFLTTPVLFSNPLFGFKMTEPLSNTFEMTTSSPGYKISRYPNSSFRFVPYYFHTPQSNDIVNPSNDIIIWPTNS